MHWILRVISDSVFVMANTRNGLADLETSPNAYTASGCTDIASLTITLRPDTFTTLNVETISVALLRISN